MAVANYAETNGHYPPAYINGPDGKPWHSWRVLILPYLDQNDLYKEYRFSEPWNSPYNLNLAKRMPPIYAFNGTHHRENIITNYVVILGEETAWPGSRALVSTDIADEKEQSILFVENQGALIPWMEPRDLSFADMDFRFDQSFGISSPYQDAAVVMMDGRVHRLQRNLPPETLRGLITIRGGEKITNPESGGWDLLSDGRNRRLQPP